MIVNDTCPAILNSRHDQTMRHLHFLAQSADSGAVWSSGGSITALEQDETACDQICPYARQLRKTRLRRAVPLVSRINGVQTGVTIFLPHNRARLKLYFRALRQFDRFKRPEYATLIDRMDRLHAFFTTLSAAAPVNPVPQWAAYIR
jgi:hypothetical protein